MAIGAGAWEMFRVDLGGEFVAAFAVRWDTCVFPGCVAFVTLQDMPALQLESLVLEGDPQE
jgi:hypothetical protein